MALFLNTIGNPTLGIGICDRCSRKFPLHMLHRDPNQPGLRVCIEDMDAYDPYRLPPARIDTITLPFYRVDVGIATSIDSLLGSLSEPLDLGSSRLG
jgi:hypothetical protein